jgi:hypothetical protein
MVSTVIAESMLYATHADLGHCKILPAHFMLAPSSVTYVGLSDAM